MKRVPVVEDEPGIALVLEDSLRLEGHDVEVLSNGLAASRRAAESEFDLVILDGMLPVTNRKRCKTRCARLPRFSSGCSHILSHQSRASTTRLFAGRPGK